MPPVHDEYIDSGNDSEEDQLNDEDYMLENVLRQPRVVSYSIEKLYALMHCGDLDLEPEYQRGFVWTEPKQMAIIDSILRNYYIPPVIFHVSYDSAGEEKRVAIDGKQRLTSIQRFIDGLCEFFPTKIPHKDSATGTRYYSAKARDLYPTKRLNILPGGLEKKFYLKQITCVEYDNLSDTQEREIFHRVQLGMPLSAAERMSAVSSHRAQTVHLLEKVLSSWPATVKLADDRKRRFQLVGHIVRGVSLLEGDPPKIALPSNAILEKWLRETGEVHNVEEMKEDLEVLIRLAKEYADIAFSSSIAATLAPIEFIFSAFLIHQFRRKMTLEQLALAIKDMRLAARCLHVDLRTNSRVSKTFEKAIVEDIPNKLIKGIYGPYDPTPFKRKRVDDDGDYIDGTAAMDISGDERKRGSRKKRPTDLTPLRSPVKSAFSSNVKSSPPISKSLFSPGPSESNTSRAASSATGNNSTPAARSAFSTSRRQSGGVGPFGSRQ